MALLESGDIEGALAAIEKEPTEGHRLHAMALIYETSGRQRAIDGGTGETDCEQSSLDVEDRRRCMRIAASLMKRLKWIDRAIERRDRGLRHVTASPYMDNMREDPRFDDVLVRVGLGPGP